MFLALVLPVFVDSGGGGFYPVAIDGVKLRCMYHDGAYLVMICEIEMERAYPEETVVFFSSVELAGIALGGVRRWVIRSW